LPRPEESGLPGATLKASLISMRHLEMDEHVDVAWFRNRRVSLPRPFAETDAYCTEETQRLLSGMSGTGVRLELHQTGLETAVIGFYRGLVRSLIAARSRGSESRLRVVPKYYSRRESSYVDGSVWG